jgi:hypothetical protein
MLEQDLDAMKAALILTLHDFFLKNPARSAIDVEDLLNLSPLFPAGFIRAVTDSLQEEGFLKNYNTAEDVGFGTAAYALTIMGLRAVSDLRAASTTQQITDTNSSEATDNNLPVPASDRFVRLDDNMKHRNAAIEQLKEIESLLDSRSNELKLDADERLSMLSEIRPLRQRLVDGCVRVGDLANAIAPRGGLAWLVDKLSGTALAEAAKAAISSITALLRSIL